MVHRDIKPGNLLLDRHGQVWVTDFGLARFGRDSALTRTGEILGTLRYLSPEQALAKHGLVDHRADVYSLGATLYELLTLRPAIEAGDGEEILRRVVAVEPRPPRQHDRAIPRDLETITLKALAKEPERRYATAQELADDLQRFLDERPIQARRPSLVERLWRWYRRNPALAAATCLAGLALLAVSTIFDPVGRQRGEPSRGVADRPRQG